MSPGNSAGTMTVDGNFNLLDSGIFDVEIGGFTTGTFDFLDVKGDADLDGSINFSFLNGYNIVTDFGPYESKEFTFLSAGHINSFNSVINYNLRNFPNFQYNVFQRGNDLVFEATNLVPVPSAIILGGLGLTFSGWMLKRKNE
jgi:hypothetical protein